MRRWGSKPAAAGASWREEGVVVGETRGDRSGEEGGGATSPRQQRPCGRRLRRRRRGWATPAAPSCQWTSSASPSAARFGHPFYLPFLSSLLQLISALREGEDGWGARIERFGLDDRKKPSW